MSYNLNRRNSRNLNHYKTKATGNLTYAFDNTNFFYVAFDKKPT